MFHIAMCLRVLRDALLQARGLWLKQSYVSNKEKHNDYLWKIFILYFSHSAMVFLKHK